MFCSKQGHNLLYNTHYKALRARLDDFSSSFVELLKLTDSCDIHTTNLNLLMIEVFKTVNNLGPKIMWDSFKFKDPNKYCLRRGRNLEIPKAHTTRDINSFDFRAAMAWNHLPNTVKSAVTTVEFKTRLKKEKIY